MVTVLIYINYYFYLQFTAQIITFSLQLLPTSFFIFENQLSSKHSGALEIKYVSFTNFKELKNLLQLKNNKPTF